MPMPFPCPLTLKGLTPTAQKQVRQQGYLDIARITLDQITDKRIDCQTIDFQNVSALININDPREPYRTAVVTLDNNIYALRPSINQLLHQLSDVFPEDYVHLKHDVCPVLGIHKLAPYICGDFWLLPMTELDGHNRSWLRWLHDDHDLAFDNQTMTVAHWRGVPQLWPLSQKRFDKRRHHGSLVARYHLALVSQLVPAGEPEDQLDVAALTQTMTARQIAQLNRKYGLAVDPATAVRALQVDRKDRLSA
ncbi:hypothetical protein [Secundilactobacillus paracollinoides]|uniref:Uncharacterized protein n=1 Tax=Secundilactobacillus paracollinoides TaxID=240427 RepID=A0A1B2IVC7_9LACO|nr:hypothetical protein [Secundilactobacillus paracollinoides]ANZ60203.1 hypothetical protein AYR61_01780 [Secundilactobacillus paracollinoides]ANZ65997.1 hypothetical protein AYR63_01800 [Secundilactobacillus paracollinoides]KRL79876.1 hypothetical protein FC17_GL000182 [Secundilactobacillus paracollinoides DSM 15502 = JCM 11969]